MTENGPDGPNAESPTLRVTRTYLELPSWEQLDPGAPPSVPSRLCPLPADPSGLQHWRRLYASVGAPYRWFDRDGWSDERLLAHLRSEGTRAYRGEAELPGGTLADAGILELARGEDGRIEIVYLGLDRAAHGLGLGRWLVTAAVHAARAAGGTGVWLHTCTLDGPAALPNYLARGFVPVRTEEYEVPA